MKTNIKFEPKWSISKKNYDLITSIFVVVFVQFVILIGRNYLPHWINKCSTFKRDSNLINNEVLYFDKYFRISLSEGKQCCGRSIRITKFRTFSNICNQPENSNSVRIALCI